jgi:hypothetical protein
LYGTAERVFEYDLLRLEEGCDRALSHLAQAGSQWIRNTLQTAIPARQISEWVATFVEDQLREPLRRLRETSQQAIRDLQQVAATTPDTPAVSEVEMLLRDLPRFELQRGLWSGWQARTQTATGYRFSASRDTLRSRPTWNVFDWTWAS